MSLVSLTDIDVIFYPKIICLNKDIQTYNKMRIIENNPYRLLGVYSNSPYREVVANQNKIRRHLSVGREISFPLDLNGFLPEISRSKTSVENAFSKLALPSEQLKYAQFWFIKCTSIDGIAFGKLINGDIDEAIEIWNKKKTVSSMQNMLVCSLIRNELGNAIGYAETLYSSYGNEFVKMVLGENALATSENLAHDFLDVICEDSKTNLFLKYITNTEWKEYVINKSAKPIIDNITSAIDTCKSSKGKGSIARLNAGTKLMNGTKTALTQLKSFVSANDLQYQMIADKLGLEILQCGIDYYNESDAADAAYIAMVLQEYAQSIVVGRMAKDRCKENVDILKKIIADLPPLQVFSEDKAIKEELMNFSKQPNTISNAVSLLNKTTNDLNSIKNKLGISSEYYLKLSTIVVNYALGNVIDEVNKAQNNIQSYEDFKAKRNRLLPLDIYDSTYDEWVRIHNVQVLLFKNVVQSAWDAILLMDKFDMESNFKSNRYNVNRSTLHNMCIQVGVSTSLASKSSTKSTSSHSTISSSQTSSTSSSSRSSSDDNGCLTGIIFTVIGAGIGSVIGGSGGAIVFAIVGFCIYSKMN